MDQATQNRMAERAKTIDLSDFNGIVQVVHQDASMMLFHHAFAEVFDNRMLLVFTEHCGYHAFHLDDLEFYRTVEYTWGTEDEDDIEAE